MTSEIVILIVAVIVVLQLFFFIKNVLRMVEYKNIFKEEKSWSISHDEETSFVVGINGKGNAVFNSIKISINKYLSSHTGSAIDFSLLKDAVDRHCDSVENDINTLTPVPLYCGLAGTMAGVIVGLYSLLTTGSITDLLSSGTGSFGGAANGVNGLLEGVAWAMLASICGIFLTTLSSLIFKNFKLKGEAGINSFLAWLQSRLLPELPTDTSQALTSLVKNLNKFNRTFADNTTELGKALKEVNTTYRIQDDIIKSVRDMDVMKMAQANVNVLKELKECTDKLEQFNQYLDDIHGYTDAIHTFTSQFEQEANRIHVLEEIRDYFMRHKAEIAKDAADVDVTLREALRTVKEAAATNSADLNSTFVNQAEEFKAIIKDEKESFEEKNREIAALFGSELSKIPMLEKQLEEISAIPGRIDRLIKELGEATSSMGLQISSTVEQSNRSLVSQVSSIMDKTVKDLKSIKSNSDPTPIVIPQMIPGWMKWTVIVSVILIALACISNTVYNIWLEPNNTTQVIKSGTMSEATQMHQDPNQL